MLFFDSLEVDATMHCNLRCVGCNHDAPAMQPWFADPAVVVRDLRRLKTVARAAHLRVVGGEPLLHPQLAALLDVIRFTRIADYLTIFTNGLLLPQMPERAWELIDSLLVTIYPTTRDRVQVDRIRQLGVRHQVDVHFRHVEEFTLQFPVDSLDATKTSQTFQTCDLTHSQRCYVVQEGRFYRCPQAMILPRLARSEPYVASAADSVDLAHPDLEAALRAYLQPQTPLPACSRCWGSRGPRIEHQQAPAAVRT
jgi:organic radical activating enzyme